MAIAQSTAACNPQQNNFNKYKHCLENQLLPLYLYWQESGRQSGDFLFSTAGLSSFGHVLSTDLKFLLPQTFQGVARCQTSD